MTALKFFLFVFLHGHLRQESNVQQTEGGQVVIEDGPTDFSMQNERNRQRCEGVLCTIDENGFKDMNGGRVPFRKEEFEHSMVLRYVKPNASVLEIGTRYGTSTCVLSRILQNSGKQVGVEADEDVWKSLEENLQRNGCRAKIFQGALGLKGKTKKKEKNGSEWTTQFGDSDSGSSVPTITYQQLEQKYNLRFDTLLVDCEGCFDQFLQDFPDSVNHVSTILLEADYGKGWQRMGNADYERVISFLKSKGFGVMFQHVVQDSPFNQDGKIMYFVLTKAF